MIRTVFILVLVSILGACAVAPSAPQQQVPQQQVGQSNCSIDGIPELQNMKGLTREQCRSLAELATSRSGSGTGVKQVAVGDGRIPVCRWVDAPGKPVVSIKDPGNPDHPVKPALAGETCKTWQIRISRS